jgi:quinol monooxygenase YgiN
MTDEEVAVIHVIATITLHPGVRDEFLAEFARLTPLVRAEDGCIEYQATVDVPTTIPAQDPPRPNVVTVVEKWASLDALYAHVTASHMDEYRSRVSDYVRGVELQVLEPAF